MSAHFRAVNWNRQKFLYDGAALGGVLLVLGASVLGGLARDPGLTVETLLIRGLALAAFLLLQVILCIGPLSRLDARWLPLLYNRRHLGVLMCLLALAHAVFALVQFHALGDVPPLESLLANAGSVRDVHRFPFELLGLAALLVFWTMLVTSHDFWLAVLGPTQWKALHMLVYVAYVLVLAHVAMGTMRTAVSPAFALVVATGAALVFGLHLAAARRERPGDELVAASAGGWVDVGAVDSVVEGRARTAMVGHERVALVRHRGRISCVSNVCRHQGGPLGEGRIKDGCLTCPWHGYQYLPDTGTSPPPFTEKLPTYRIKAVGGRLLVHQIPNAPGTPVTPVVADGSPTAAEVA